MTLQEVLSAIDGEPVRFTIMDDADLDAWAQYAAGVFNEPAPADAMQVVEIIGRRLAGELRAKLEGRLEPSAARLTDAFKRVCPNETDDMYRQLAMWCEVVSVYISQGDS